MDESQVKASWHGTVVSVQPRSTVWRYRLDNRTHRECGFNLFVKGSIDWGEESPSCAVRAGRAGASPACGPTWQTSPSSTTSTAAR